MRAETAALIMMSGKGKPDLEDITITENGEYESVDHDGFGVVTVEVPTMVECAEEVAEILGVDTSQEWDCDDIKAKAQEVVDENEEMQECCDEVVDVIHIYDEDYDPHPDPPDPTNPTIPEKIQEIIDEQKGVVVPDGVDPGSIAVQLGANTQAQATIDGKTISVSLSGYGYYAYGPPAENYTPVENDNPILEYLSAFGQNMPLYTAYDEAPAPTAAYTYRTYMYAVTLEGFPTMYTFNSASNNLIDATYYVAELALSVLSNSTLLVNNYNGKTLAYVTAATGKSFTTDGTVKIV